MTAVRSFDTARLPQVRLPLSAGMIAYSAFRCWRVGAGHSIGIVGFGQIGKAGIRLTSAFGADVALFTPVAGCEPEARSLGAGRVIPSADASAMAAAGSCDFILHTGPEPHALHLYLPALRPGGLLRLVSRVGAPGDVRASDLRFAAEQPGRMAVRREMIEFCIANNIHIEPVEDCSAP